MTGASAGSGKATAKLFQSKGWKVIATMRKPEIETELNQLDNVVLLPLDVTNIEQISSTVREAFETGTVDVVLNNASYGLAGPVEAYSEALIEEEGREGYKKRIFQYFDLKNPAAAVTEAAL